MKYWIFKLSKQELYPDVAGTQYVFDNTHSIKVTAGDAFLYLDKTKDYSFTATGVIKKIEKREPTETEASRTKNVRVVYTAYLSDVYYFDRPLSIDPKLGFNNRKRLGIVDVNKLGWSHSLAGLNVEMFNSILDLVEEKKFFTIIPKESHSFNSFEIDDRWSITKRRAYLYGFSQNVKSLCNQKCIVCGVKNAALLDSAHIIPYSIDKKNRANPANGICLCKYCHAAYDSQLIEICHTGVVDILDDEFLSYHRILLSVEERSLLIAHAVDFLKRKATIR